MDVGADEVRALIACARRGERAAQDEIFRRYRNYLELLARISLPRTVQAKFDASDIVQDVFVSAHQGFGGFRGESAEELVGWFKRILTNRLADASRRFIDNEGRGVDRERSLEAMIERSSAALRAFPAARGTSPSHGAHRREVGELVADALAELKQDDREVIVLRSLEEREWNDVAQRMGRHPEAVRALWGRAFARLGAVLEDKGWTDR
jgi:RNA polymerase sigma-70 factor (ECF subfamily)